MSYLFIFILLMLNIIFGIIIFNITRKLNSQKDQYKKEYIYKKQSQFDKQLQQLEEELKLKEQSVKKANEIISNQQQHIKEIKATQEELINSEKEKINRIVSEYKENQEQLVELKLEQSLKDKQKELASKFNEEETNTLIKINKLQQDLLTYQEEVEEWQKKRDAINEEIIRARVMNEKQDFYRICLPQETFEDVEIFNSIRMKLHNRQALDKMLYDNYVSKPTKEMIKRVLNGKDPSGIYKITNIQTKECYIGKSVNVGTRWQNHIKSACGLEGVADSMFQRALKKYGIDQFTFELLEEVPKANLTEREKYYITLFDTTKFGYNMKIG